MATQKHLIHRRSNEVNQDNTAKLPKSEDLAYGELAVNYADNYEVISLRNSANDIITFSSDEQLKKFMLDNYVNTSGDTMTGALNILNTFNVGEDNNPVGKYSTTQGSGCTASGLFSNAHGTFTKTNNNSENGLGLFNTSTPSSDAENVSLNELVKSSIATLFSIGNGYDNDHRNNALEIKYNGDTIIDGNTRITKNLTVNGDTQLDKNLGVNGNTNIGGNTTVGGNTILKQKLNVSGETTIDNNLWVSDNTNIGGNVNIT